MRVITVKQPWAYLLAAGLKTIENRRHRTEYRGVLLIQASCRRRAAESDESIEQRFDVRIPSALPRCGIVGVVSLVDCVNASDDRWFVGPWGWVVRNARPIAPLIEWRGALHLQVAPASLVRSVNRLL